mmetsp:Transcript_12987/g.37376  ORF Transcript_12987/g.37376 Transcript_12987/m.37376 type:complete len:240 (-) Transcript_12987:5323-6042(-)
MAAASSKHSMALPMAVSSWNTARLLGSLGLTVFLFLISGRFRVPPEASNVPFKVFKFSHRLFVLKYECSSMSSKAALSPSAHMALSLRIRRPSDFLLARCPPFLSLAVRLHTSIINEYPDSAKCDSNERSRVAPRLSELDTNTYSTPRDSSLSSIPLPTIAAYISPCPGGAHSMSGFSGNSTGASVSASTLQELFCISSTSSSSARSGCFSFKKAQVSADVEKLFIRMNLTLLPNSLRV